MQAVQLNTVHILHDTFSWELQLHCCVCRKTYLSFLVFLNIKEKKNIQAKQQQFKDGTKIGTAVTISMVHIAYQMNNYTVL